VVGRAERVGRVQRRLLVGGLHDGRRPLQVRS
jgi:hypothetical protein